jgi:hypothetical protein
MAVFCVHLHVHLVVENQQQHIRENRTVRQGRRHGPSITHKILTRLYHSPFQPARRASMLGHPSSFRPHFV